MAIDDERNADQGIRCPSCNCAHCPVRRTVQVRHKLVRRYRVCRHCGRNFATTERVNGSHK